MIWSCNENFISLEYGWEKSIDLIGSVFLPSMLDIWAIDKILMLGPEMKTSDT